MMITENQNDEMELNRIAEYVDTFTREPILLSYEEEASLVSKLLLLLYDSSRPVVIDNYMFTLGETANMCDRSHLTFWIAGGRRNLRLIFPSPIKFRFMSRIELWRAISAIIKSARDKKIREQVDTVIEMVNKELT